MKIIDCVTYFDEDVLLDLRLNILYEFVDKFVICEGAYDHRGNKRETKFNINNFKKFSDKIIYLKVDDFPSLEDPWKMLRHQRNSSMKYIRELDPDDYVLISDVDEIPNPHKLEEFTNNKNEIGVFKQLFFYYKLNLLNFSSPEWFGTKICKVKKFKNPDWLRSYKYKQYPWWRFDKPKNLKIIPNGGWHFSFLYDVEGIIKKISSYQHTEFDNKNIKNYEKIKKKIIEGEDIFNRGYKFKKINIDEKFPNYIINNKNNLKNWIED
tara:strand:- start:3042 stop:3839 length:798 start_codon:yes stop_codon:yes gene_type:complete